MTLSEEDTIQVFKPSKEISSKAYIKSMEKYKEMYEESIKNPEKFWGKIAEKYLG